MSIEAGLMSGMDNLEAQLESNLGRADCCVNPWCGRLISSRRQNEIEGVKTCDECGKAKEENPAEAGIRSAISAGISA